MADTFSIYPAEMIEVVIAFVSAYGAVLSWNLPRYRPLAYILVYQAVLMTLNLYEHINTAMLISPLFTLLKGPLHYLFIRTMVNGRPLRGWTLYGQIAIPIVLVLLVDKVQVAILAGSISQVTYLTLSFRLLRRYHRAAQAFRSDADALKLTWLTVAYWMVAAQAVIGLIRLNLQTTLNPELASTWFSFDLLFLLGISCFLLFKALQQPLLYNGMLVHEDAAGRPPTSGLESDAAEAKSVFARLEALIVAGELYRKQRLSIDDLASATGMQMKDISWAFNVGSGSSFNEYINRLRVTAFKRRLRAGNAGSGSLLDLAFESGFSSKSSFNAIFKRETGMTPSQYIKREAVDGGDEPHSTQGQAGDRPEPRAGQLALSQSPSRNRMSVPGR